MDSGRIRDTGSLKSLQEGKESFEALKKSVKEGEFAGKWKMYGPSIMFSIAKSKFKSWFSQIGLTGEQKEQIEQAGKQERRQLKAEALVDTALKLSGGEASKEAKSAMVERILNRQAELKSKMKEAISSETSSEILGDQWKMLEDQLSGQHEPQGYTVVELRQMRQKRMDRMKERYKMFRDKNAKPQKMDSSEIWLQAMEPEVKMSNPRVIELNTQVKSFLQASERKNLSVSEKEQQFLNSDLFIKLYKGFSNEEMKIAMSTLNKDNQDEFLLYTCLKYMQDLSSNNISTIEGRLRIFGTFEYAISNQVKKIIYENILDNIINNNPLVKSEIMFTHDSQTVTSYGTESNKALKNKYLEYQEKLNLINKELGIIYDPNMNSIEDVMNKLKGQALVITSKDYEVQADGRKVITENGRKNIIDKFANIFVSESCLNREAVLNEVKKNIEENSGFVNLMLNLGYEDNKNKNADIQMPIEKIILLYKQLSPEFYFDETSK